MEDSNDSRSRLFPTPTLLGMFFLSGAAGLIYQTLWSKHLQLIFGSTTEAVSVVLATFMSGLGLGSYLFAARADRMRHPIRLYAWLEIGIGIFAILTTPLLRLATSLYSGIAGSLELTGASAMLLKLIVSVFVLLPPAVLMGGTFPAIVRTPSGTDRRRRVAGLYAVNILGAVAGALLTGFYFVHSLGLSATMLLAAALNIAIGLVVLLLSKRFDLEAEIDDVESRSALDSLRDFFASQPGRIAVLGLFVSGATTMLYEIIFTRILVIIFGVSTHAFTIVLAAFLTGLGLGAICLALLLRRYLPTLWGFALSQIGVAIAATLVIAILPAFPRLLLYLHQIPGLDFWDVFGVKAILLFLILVPIATIAGLSMPLLLAALARDERHLSRSVGAAYVVNTAGTLVGSLAAGFLVIPLLGSEVGLKLTIGINVAVALATAIRMATRRQKLFAFSVGAVVIVAALSARWSADLYLRSDSRGASAILDTRLKIEQHLSTRATDLLFFREGRNATVAVTAADGARVLFVNGHPDASDQFDMSTQSLLGIVPLLVKKDAREVMVIGFGSGVSADRVARGPQIQRVDVVEIENAVIDASPAFHHVNGRVERNPKVRIILDDARTVLQTRGNRYDLIVSEPSNPWRAGVATLFTQDFYRLAISRLNTGGVFAQWVQLYDIETESLAMILSTFSSAFAETQVWFLDGGNIAILGSNSKMEIELDFLRNRIWTSYRTDFERYGGLASPDEILGLYVGDQRSLRAFASSPELHTDDLPLLEAAAEEGLLNARHATNARHLLAAKMRAETIVPPLAKSASVPDLAAVWMGISRLHAMARDQDAALVARKRAFNLAKDDGVKAEAATIGADLDNLCAEAEPFVAHRRARMAFVRCLLRRGDVGPALEQLKVAGKLSPLEMFEIAPLFARARQPRIALGIFRELIPQIRLGTAVGAKEGSAILGELPSLADQGVSVAELMVLVDRVPKFVGTVPPLRARALLFYLAKDYRTALPLFARLRELGWLEEVTVMAEAESATRVLGAAEAARLLDELKALAPETMHKPPVSPLLDGR